MDKAIVVVAGMICITALIICMMVCDCIKRQVAADIHRERMAYREAKQNMPALLPWEYDEKRESWKQDTAYRKDALHQEKNRRRGDIRGYYIDKDSRVQQVNGRKKGR